ncbi:hypothetical protein DJ533_10755 [Acinetobacter defluvii]|uniref:Uncharacterized protein n=1 Tax=Acinetobacter defluvii TaxID=1871111 RepID=A0A2S2FDF8_9GAMM|nr:hypothetical protein DJ533_10755 [Acinetobacter defluvii]
MKQVVKPKNLDAFRIWFDKLGYQVKCLSGKGFTARTNDRYIKKCFHYVLVTDSLGGNDAAFKLGKEFEDHLRAPEQTCTEKAEMEIRHMMKGDENGVLSFVA